MAKDRTVALTEGSYTKVSTTGNSISFRVPRIGFGASEEDSIAWFVGPTTLTGTIADHDKLASSISGGRGNTNAIYNLDITSNALYCRWNGNPNKPVADKYVIVNP